MARYGLTGTTAPYNGHWDVTLSTASDLVRYYDMLLDGTGGLPPEQANVIISNLAQSTPTGTDGYPQRFGIPEGLYAEPVAVKQGWFCCWNGANQLHVSTGAIGPERRYVMAISSLEPDDDAAARENITQAVKTMFPAARSNAAGFEPQKSRKTDRHRRRAGLHGRRHRTVQQPWHVGTRAGRRGYIINNCHFVNIAQCGTHPRFPGVMHCATPPPYRRWPGSARHRQASACRRHRPPLPR